MITAHSTISDTEWRVIRTHRMAKIIRRATTVITITRQGFLPHPRNAAIAVTVTAFHQPCLTSVFCQTETVKNKISMKKCQI